MTDLKPLYTVNPRDTPERTCQCTPWVMYALALLVSLISWTACVTLLAAEENVVEPFTFDTKLALFVSRNESEKCLPVGAASNGTNQCPANVISQYAQSFSGSPCTRIAPMQSLGSSVVEIKWGEQRFTRYPVSISASDSDKFWGGFLNNANALVLLLFVFTVSALFQTWRLMYLETTDNDLSRDEPCAYHGCQYNPANHDDATWAHLLSFRAAHGSHFSMWIEYTFTASVQLLVIAFNFQGFSVDELFFVLLIQGCLTLLGWIVENALDAMYYPCQYQHPKMLLFGQASHYSLLARAACVEILAWFLHVTLWVSMFEKYNNVKAEVKNLQKLESSPQCGHGHDIPDVPWFVDAILYSQFVFYTSFGLVQLSQFAAFLYYHSVAASQQKRGNYGQQWRQDNFWVWKTSATAYAFLNVVSKACLAFILVAGAVM